MCLSAFAVHPALLMVAPEVLGRIAFGGLVVARSTTGLGFFPLVFIVTDSILPMFVWKNVIYRVISPGFCRVEFHLGTDLVKVWVV
jgi:hypothetical protein